jgi:hypothetical protein
MAKVQEGEKRHGLIAMRMQEKLRLLSHRTQPFAWLL